MIINANAIASVHEKLQPDGRSATMIEMVNGRSVMATTSFRSLVDTLQSAECAG